MVIWMMLQLVSKNIKPSKSNERITNKEETDDAIKSKMVLKTYTQYVSDEKITALSNISYSNGVTLAEIQ